MEFQGLACNETMFLTGVEAEKEADVMGALAGLAKASGYVNDTFLPALLEREREYPTGLPTVVPVAIPHVHDGCLQSFFAMATLAAPLAFGCMGDPDVKVETRLVFLFGITDPSQQTQVLRRFSAAFQDNDFLNECTDCADAAGLGDVVRQKLGECLVFE